MKKPRQREKAPVGIDEELRRITKPGVSTSHSHISQMFSNADVATELTRHLRPHLVGRLGVRRRRPRKLGG